jgi:hypothetical protein
MRELTLLLLAAAAACQTAPRAGDDAWRSPATDGPVLCGTVTDPAGRPLEGVEVRPHSGFDTRFPGTPVSTDARGHYRIHPVEGSFIGNEFGVWDLYVGVCAGSVQNANPAAFLPWKDVRVPQTPGFVLELDFVFDRDAIPAEFRDG